ncbi:MAG: hypothetical protein ACI89X_003652 [Planctomycetota bacterium]|jgi:hypothetical protein
MSNAAITPGAADPLQAIRQRFAPLTRALLDHEVYSKLTSIHALRIFVQHHCFAVWDFMSLLKTLQGRLTCVTAPWTPPKNREGARLINEIVVAEESDQVAAGDAHSSHFELYLDAMREIGADTSIISSFVDSVATDKSWQGALADARIHPSIARFVERTMSLCAEGDDWEVATDFVLGREKLIPDMFRQVTAALTANADMSTDSLSYYLDRHIELDEDEHGPAGARLLSSLCQSDTARWNAVERVARQALQARIELWDGVVMCIDELGDPVEDVARVSVVPRGPQSGER